MRITEMMKLKKLLMTLVLLPLMVLADTEMVDGITWTYTISGGTAEVKAGYCLSAIPSTTTGAISIPLVLGGKPVTSIGNYAFYSCSGLTSVTIPSSITSIGDSAFYYCSGLTAVTIPSGVTRIGSYAFEYCSGLKSMTIPKSVTDIGYSVFYGCTGIESITLPFVGSRRGNGGNFSSLFGSGSGSVPATLTKVAITDDSTLSSYAFQNCKYIESITLPIGMSSIGHGAFQGCESLRSISLPVGVSEIGSYAFQRCLSLTDMTIPVGVQQLESSVFEECLSLGRVTLPVGLTTIGYGAFRNCRSLYRINIPNTVTLISSGAFTGCTGLGSGVVVVDKCLLAVNGDCPANVVIDKDVRLIVGGTFNYSESVQSVTINAQIEELPDDFFEYCSNLKKVVLPSSLRVIGDWAFCGCHSLEDIQLPEGLVEIQEGAFNGCASIRSFNIPASVTELWSWSLPTGWYDDDEESLIPSRLTKLTVASGNKVYAAYDNVLYSKDGQVLLYCLPAVSSVTIRKGTKRIADGAFQACSKLTDLTIPEGVVEFFDPWDEDWASIGSADDEGGAFDGCTALRSISLPSTLEYIDDIGNLPALTKLTVAAGNRKYAAYDNVFYDKEEKQLLWCPQALRQVKIWDKTESIASYAFGWCDKLESLTIPASVREIGTSPFWGCEKLKAVYYKGDAPFLPSYGDLYALYNGCFGPEYLNVTSYVQKGTKWWGDSGEWQGRPLVFVDSIDNPVVRYAVSFDPCGGETLVGHIEIESGKPIGTLPTYSRVGYTFDGWYTAPEGGTKITTQTKVTEDVTYYAHATPITYKVRFNPNCGTGKMADQLFVYDQEQSLAMNSFKLSSHTFVGWSTSASGKMSIKDLFWDEQSVSNLCARQGATIDLYATWTRASSILEATHKTAKKYDPEDREYYWYEWSSNVTLERGSSHLFWMTPIDAESCLYMDIWYEDDDDYIWPSERLDKENEDGTLTEYHLLTAEDWGGFGKASARFSILVEGFDAPEFFRFGHCDLSVRWEVVFNANGGEDAEWRREVAHNKAIGTLPTPTRSKYKFLGWYTAAEGGTKISSTTKVQGDVTYYAQWTYDGSATVAVNVGSGCEGMGTVSGGKTAKAGTKVTLKATAKPGYVFVGWYRDAEGWDPVEGETDYRSPSYSCVVGEDDATFYAMFIPVEDDWVSVWCWAEEEYARGVEIEPLKIEVDSESLATVKVTGLPTGLKFTAKALDVKATSKTPAVHYEANTIYGTPTKSGIYTVTITATTASKKSETYTADFVVRGEGEYLVDVMGIDGADYPDNGSDAQHAIQWGKMSGYGVFAPNKTATLKATANKGYVFAGWFSEVACVCEGGVEDDGCVYIPAEGAVDYRSTSFPVKAGYEDVLYYARFVWAEDDDKLWANVEDAYYLNGAWSLTLDIESMSLPTVTVKGLPSGLKFNSKTLTISGTPTKPGTYPITLSLKNTTIKKARTQGFTLYVANIESPYLSGVDYTNDAYVYRVGTSMEFDLGSCARDGYSVTGVSGLPSGLKFDKNSGLITGVPTKAGPKTVTITLKNGNQTSSATITLNVDAIDTWAYGTFNGGGEDGVLTLTVGNTGKISGKWMTVDGTWTLSAKSYESYDEDDHGRYRSLVEAKCGTKTAYFWLDVCGGQADIYEYLSSLCGYGSLVAKAKRNVWKDDQRKDLAIQMMGASFALTDEVSLKVGSFGAVTATGKFVTGRNANGKDIVYSASCSTVLVPVEADVFKLYLCFPKKDGKFDGMTLQEVLEWSGSELSIRCAGCREEF